MLACVSAKEKVACCDENDVKIFSNGDCIWYREYRVSVSHCAIDITWFPFDDQLCDFVFESKTHESKELNFTRMSVPIVLDYYSDNGEWDLIGKYSNEAGDGSDSTF